jgi:hypothetical protein
VPEATPQDVPSACNISSFWQQFSTIADPGAIRTRTSRKAAPQPPSAGSTNPGSSGMCVCNLDIPCVRPLLDAAPAPPHSRTHKPAVPAQSTDTSAQGVFQ